MFIIIDYQKEKEPSPKSSPHSLLIEKLNSKECPRKSVSEDKFEISCFLTLQHQCLEIDSSAPNAEFEVEHVYGYRANDCSNNLHYTESGKAVFMTAALGVSMDTETGSQRVYGGK